VRIPAGVKNSKSCQHWAQLQQTCVASDKTSSRTTVQFRAPEAADRGPEGAAGRNAQRASEPAESAAQAELAAATKRVHTAGTAVAFDSFFAGAVRVACLSSEPILQCGSHPAMTSRRPSP